MNTIFVTAFVLSGLPVRQTDRHSKEGFKFAEESYKLKHQGEKLCFSYGDVRWPNDTDSF